MNTIRGIFAKIGNFFAGNIFPCAIILVAGILAIRLLMKLVTTALEKTKLEQTAINLIKSVMQVVLYILLGLTAASKLGIDVTGIVALASVLTLAVSLSVQTALTNIIGGFTLLYTKPFAIGDFVEIAGQSGTVKGIGLTYTKMATADNKVISIPNSAITAAQIINYSVSGTRRVDVTVTAAYTASVEQVLEALKEAGSVPEALDTHTPFAAVKEYGESAIVYVLQVWCKGEDYWTTFFKVNRNVKEVFDARGIEMTYPHLNVHLDK